jgi:hypothetical protein
LLALAVLAIGYLALAPVLHIGGVTTPPPHPPAQVFLGQWPDRKESVRFHHTSQGTRILPLSWFMALEQPVLTPLPVGRLAARDYLSRFGFIYETEAPEGIEYAAEKPAAERPATTASQADVYQEIAEDLARYDLPVGFAIEKAFVAPYARPPIAKPMPVVGLSCAGCHTGRIDVKLDDGTYKSVLIDGGSAMIHVALFQDAVSRALYFTQLMPTRFRRFARNVFGTDLPESDPDLQKLRSDLDEVIRAGLTTRNYAKEHKLNVVEGGFSRTDALGLIGNRVFGVLDEENQVVTNAPVNYPQLWDTAWFDWVQYNASIRTPMTRNIGEALGVGASVNLNDASDPDFPAYSSTVNVGNLAWMEDLLGGDDLFEGLQPPRWEDMVRGALGKDADERSPYYINRPLAERGKALYLSICIRCHVPPRPELKQELAKPYSPYFSEPDPDSGKRFIRLNVVDLHVIGTDPNEALNFYRRVAVAGEPAFPEDDDRADGSKSQPGAPKSQANAPAKKPFAYWSRWVKENVTGGPWAATISAEDGLFRVTALVRAGAYRSEAFQLLPREGGFKQNKFKDEPARKRARMRWDRYRTVPGPIDMGGERAVIEGRGKDWVIKANLGYRARTHDGIWATPPYLHNGAVPNLYQMLVPAERRSRKFHLGSTRFDPKHVGYETVGFEGSFEMDTSLPGNSNGGHEFRNLTLEELENFKPWDGISSREVRWARVLGLASPDELARKSAEELWRLMHDATERALKDPQRLPIKGVLGPEFNDDERWQIVEYLKTL